MVENIEILSKFPFILNAGNDFKAKFSQIAKEVVIPQGHCIFESGSQMESVALLLRGKVRVYMTGPTGREITLYYVSPGEMCPTNLMFALLDRKSPASAVPITPCQAVVIPAAVFRNWVDDQPSVRMALVETLSSRLIDMMALIEEISFQKMDRRLGDFLLVKFRDSRDSPPKIRLTHEDIAAELGSAREVISRLLTEFERLDILQTGRGCITLCNANLLEEFTAEQHLPNCRSPLAGKKMI